MSYQGVAGLKKVAMLAAMVPNACRSMGVRAECLSSRVALAEREELLAAHKERQIQV
jgi:hypothetical protein